MVRYQICTMNNVYIGCKVDMMGGGIVVKERFCVLLLRIWFPLVPLTQMM